MLEIAPFRAIRYAESDPKKLSTLIAPPYDVISPPQREKLAAKNAHNVVQLILPSEKPGDGADDNKYTRAGKAFRQWIAEGVLRADKEPGLYVLHQRFEWNNVHHLRKGFLARLRLREFKDGVVLPHEKTLSGPKADRLELFKQAKANLSPIFSLYPDDGNEIEQLLTSALNHPADASAQSDDGHGSIEHRMWRVTEPTLLAKVRAAMATRRAYIADGHHRYETALNYARLVDQSLPEPRPDGAHHFVLSFFCGMADPGLLILPTHRLLHGMADFELSQLVTEAEQYFDVEWIKDDVRTPDGLALALRKLADAGKTRPSFLVVGDQGTRTELFKLGPNVDLAQIEEMPKSPQVRALDVAVLHGLLFQRTLQLSPQSQEKQENLRYVKEASEAVAAVVKGTDHAAFLLNGTLMRQVREVAEAGYVMPQKSTFFYPKLPSGLVFNALDPEDKVSTAGPLKLG
jgi:uncharacterized protein (DUF1015 family)